MHAHVRKAQRMCFINDPPWCLGKEPPCYPYDLRRDVWTLQEDHFLCRSSQKCTERVKTGC